jgi:hypothetical protein
MIPGTMSQVVSAMTVSPGEWRMCRTMSATGSILKALALLGLVLFLGPPVRAQYPQEAATAGASDTTVETGQRITVGGEGWKPSSIIDLTWSSHKVRKARADGHGRFFATLVVPSDASAGESFIRASGVSFGGEPSQIAVRMLVGRAPTSEPKREVDFSLASLALWTLIAFALFLVGVGAVAQVRRRTPSQR